MPQLHSFEQRLVDCWPPEDWQDVSILVAVSGGADSVALVRAMTAINGKRAGKLFAAHFNHRLRGGESDADEQFVADLCQKLHVTCSLGNAGTKRVESGGDGLEAAARTARYEFLRATAERLGARYVVTAHTADDQAETVLQRIVRGTGLSGLAGIPRARALGPAVTLLRPLLEIRRADVVDYLAALGQAWREDRTNLEMHIQRNRIRGELVPLLERDYNRGIVDALLRLARLAADAQQVIDEQVSALMAVAVKLHAEEGAVVACGELAGRPRHLVREMFVRLWALRTWPLQSMGFVEWDLLAEMALIAPDAESGAKRILPGNIEAERHADRLSLKRLP